MKLFFLLRYFCVALILSSILPVSLNKSLANPPDTVQARIDYSKYMELGYTATRQGNYAEALDYFKQALYEKPGDRYATIAIGNLENYVLRDRRAGKKQKSYVTYIPTNLGIPTRRTSGATRGSHIHLNEAGEACIQGKQHLTALTPEFDAQRTTKANPTFLFYVPQTSAPVMELVLQDDQEEVIYQKTLPAPSQAGIVSLSLPVGANVPKLQVGKSYQWYFSLICDRKERSSDYVVHGLIERIAPDQTLQTQLAKTKPEEQAAIYALSGIWENSLTIVSQLRQSTPNSLAVNNDWEDLLRSGGLEALINEPLIPCCTLK